MSRVSFIEMSSEDSEQAIGLIKEVMLRARGSCVQRDGQGHQGVDGHKMGPTVWHVIVGEQVSTQCADARAKNLGPHAAAGGGTFFPLWDASFS